MRKSTVDYYKNYTDNNGYSMTSVGITSRVANLMSLIKEHTPKGGKILDVGCGDMNLANLLPDYDWTGLDINSKQGNPRRVEHNIEVTPYPLEANSFDTIVCSEVLEHMFNPLDITKEIRRLIKPTGTYVMSTPNFHYLDNYLTYFSNMEFNLSKPWTQEHIRYYTFESHEQMLNAAGFEIETVTGADAQFSTFFCQGREALQACLQGFGLKDPNFTKTDQLIGAMFPLHNHTIMFVAKPIPLDAPVTL